MERTHESADVRPRSGRSLHIALLVVLLMLAAALVLTATPTGADRATDLTWDRPSEGSFVSRDVDVIVRASANVTNVTFYYRSTGDFQFLGNGTFSPPDYYSTVWNTRLVVDGTYELLANATLSGGGHSLVNLSDVKVDNTPPTISFKTPTQGIRINGYFIIRVLSSIDVVSVDLYVNTGPGYEPLGSAQHEAGSVNWTFVWNTTGFSDLQGVELLASGRDAAGNEHRISVLDVHIDNVGPSVRLVNPVENGTLDGHVHLTANCTDEHLVDAYFEWRQGTGSWNRIGEAVWNASLSLWVTYWNTYMVGEMEDLEVRVTVVDDLGLRGHSSATGVDIIDLPPEPVFLAPLSGAHLTGTCQLVLTSANDTESMRVCYLDGTDWVEIGQCAKGTDGVWTLSWETGDLSLYDTTLRVEAFDAVGNGTTLLADIEVDNTHPAPFFLAPTSYQFQIYGTVPLVVNSDRDTVSVNISYLDEELWVEVVQAFYNPNTDRWEGVWFIPEDLYVKASALRALATDEVGLTGEAILDHMTINLPPGDIAPEFQPSMPEVIYIDEDDEYILSLADHIDDDDPSTLKVYVTEEPKDLFYVDGENVTGNLDLTVITLPDRNGQALVSIHVVDPAGQLDTVSLQVIVRSVPDPPSFTDVPPNLYVRYEVVYTFNFIPYVDDPDSDLEDLVLLKPDDPHISKVATNPLALEFLYSKRELDQTFFVNITLRDPDGHIAWISIMVWVVDDWVPELRTPLPDIWMDEDTDKESAFDLDTFFHDKDHNALYYSYGNRYVRVVIGNEYPHTVSIYPPKDWHGTDSVTFRATDPEGALLEDTIIVHCNSTNDPPVFRDRPKLPDLVIPANETFDFDLSPYVLDVDHELGELTLLTNDPRATRSTKYTLGIRLHYPMMPDFILIVTVADPEGSTTAPRSINVFVGNNRPPILIDPPPDIVMVEGETRAQSFSVTSSWDPDWYDEPGTWQDLTFEFVGDPVSFQVANDGWVSIHLPDPDWNTYNGSHNLPLGVLCRVMDAKRGLTEYTFKLTVLPVNDPPELDKINILEISPSIVTIDLRNYVRDVDTPFTELTFKVVDASLPDKVVNYVSVHGWLLVLDYKGSPTRTDRLSLQVLDQEHVIDTPIVVKVKAKKEPESTISLWVVLAVVCVTGTVAVVASRYVWGRFEPPSVSDVFLVYGDGVIIRHMSKRGTMSMDEDLAIAMLTAIQEFVQQSMRSAQLKSMQAGENNILIERDPSKLFYIAVIHTGSVTEELRRAINYATRSIKEDFGEVLVKWDGNIAKFEGVERYLDQILAISHAAIPEGVRFEMEGITSIEPGKTYLFQGKDVTRTHNIFRGLVEDAGSGLLISRVHPQRLHPSVPEAGAECVWLSKTPTKRGVSPSNTTMILHEITSYVKEHERTVVCLDGLEYLLVHNPLDEVVAFVNELTDMAQVDDFTMMIHVDPYALDDATLAKLSRNMVPVSDRTPANNRR